MTFDALTSVSLALLALAAVVAAGEAFWRQRWILGAMCLVAATILLTGWNAWTYGSVANAATDTVEPGIALPTAGVYVGKCEGGDCRFEISDDEIPQIEYRGFLCEFSGKLDVTSGTVLKGYLTHLQAGIASPNRPVSVTMTSDTEARMNTSAPCVPDASGTYVKQS